MRKRLLHQAVRLLLGIDHMIVVAETAVQADLCAVVVIRLRPGFSLAVGRLGARSRKAQRILTTAMTFSMITSFARSMDERDPTNSIGRSMSLPFWGAGETLILQPVSTCMFLIVSPPIAAIYQQRSITVKKQSPTFANDHAHCLGWHDESVLNSFACLAITSNQRGIGSAQ